MAEKDIIKRLGAEVERLIADHERIAAECRALQKERDRLQGDKHRLEEKLREQDARLKSLELTEGMRDSEESVARARMRVNSLLREVDRCIAMMTKEQEE